MGLLYLGIEFAAPHFVRLTLIALPVLLAFNSAFCAEEKKPTACNEDAMLVFDASGSMGGSCLLYTSPSPRDS